ncbi:hypothetical protein TTHERM_00622810 (macronuclear) [Tetrahymena thermophila SB210]|uniref:Uncharacterized protein n=1 Tax=Tetrahymena thermophila (strain SB210) TaxID=312017 RepID=Q241A3_TETTS|nr:hypothetical protein TTHERM_00622810 [Tetrahymena thermophila SB210]EAS02261.1 hypothetical protein TTHERM_00622810 [Tetrahymena thermophila SB210]|eukprot:XP_001022506.1 hypothetical protein TTHERM_00622810 [Tetrahymena thermophila SB210]
MKNKLDKDSKQDIKHQITYFQEVKNIVQKSKSKQQSRQFDEITFLNYLENYNPINQSSESDQCDENLYNENEIQNDENLEQKVQSDADSQDDQQLDQENLSDDQNDSAQNDQKDCEQELTQEQMNQNIEHQNNMQKQQDKQISDLKQKITFYQFMKQQILNILQKNDQDITNLKPITAADFTNEETYPENQMSIDSELSNQRFKTMSLINRFFSKYQHQLNLEYQEKLNNISSSSLEQGFENSKIKRKNVYPFYFSSQEIQILNYFEFSPNSVQKPDSFKKNLQQKLSEEKRLNFINLQFNKGVDKKLIQKIEDNELILDLIPSTIFTKVIDLNISTNNLLSILLAAKCLSQISNFNVLNIEGDNASMDQKNKSNYHNYLRLVFDSILQQRALQSLSLFNIPLFSQSFLASLQSIDLGQCYIDSLQLESYISEKDQQDLLKVIQCLPYLKSFQCQGLILDTKEKIELLNNILRKITCAKIVILQLPDNFDFLFEFQNIKFLEIHIGIGKQKLTNRKLENFFKSLSTSKNLKYLKFRFFLSIKKKKNLKKKEDNHEQEHDNQNEDDEIEEQQNQNNEDCDNQNDNEEEEDNEEDDYEKEEDEDEQNQNIDSDDDEIYFGRRKSSRRSRNYRVNYDDDEEEEEQVLCDDEINFQQSYKFFNYLNHLEDLQDVHFELELSQKLAESLTSFLKQSKNQKKFFLKSNEDFTDNTYYQAFLQEFQSLNSAKVDFKNIYEIIGNKKNLQNFHLKLRNYSIQYQQQGEKDNNYVLNIQQESLPLNNIGFNPIVFQLPNLVEFCYKTSNKNIDCYQQLSYLLSSLQKSENLQKIDLLINNEYSDDYQNRQKKQSEIEDIKRKNFNSKIHTLFSSLNDLSQLYTIKLSIELDEILLNSLSNFIQGNKNLKYLYLEGANSYWHASSVNLKGFAKLIWSLGKSQSLKLISFNKIFDFYGINQTQQQLLQDEIVIPLAKLIENKDRNLTTIELLQELKEDQIEIILNSLLASISPINIKFNYRITNSIRESENLQKLYDQYKDKNKEKNILDRNRNNWCDYDDDENYW